MTAREDIREIERGYWPGGRSITVTY